MAMIVLLAAGLMLPSSSALFSASAAEQERVSERHATGYWPLQASAPAFRRVTMTTPGLDDRTRLALRMTAASLAGVAARAVNEGNHDELVWHDVAGENYERWLTLTLERQPMEERNRFPLSELLAHYHEIGLVKGYVLYRADRSSGPHYEHRDGIDVSVNAATMIAGAGDGLVLIEESQLDLADSLGLPMVFDARDISEEAAFLTVKDRLSPTAMLTIDPRVYQLRDLAIAHGYPLVYGTGDFFNELLAWVEPNSIVLGWNAGDEGEHTAPPSAHGLVQTASNWSQNIILLSSGLDSWDPSQLRLPESDPTSRQSPTASYAAFQISDGDNVQYLMGSFFDSDDFWASSLRGQYPIGWSICAAHLSQAAPVVLSYLQRTASPADSFAEFSGGYFYPDLFATERSDERRRILERHADMLADRMAVTGTRVLTFICKDIESDGAREAYRVFAERIPSLLGMIAVQYYPYNRGGGEVFWVENPQGEPIPVLTPRFAIWENARWRGAGTPARVARLKNEFTTRQAQAGEPAFSLVAVHNWSMFRYTDDDNEDGENISREERESSRVTDGHRGLHSVRMTVDRLHEDTVIVTPEEMIRLIRENHQGLSLKGNSE